MSAPGWQRPENYRKSLFPIQVGDTPLRLKTRISIGFQADTPKVNRTVVIIYLK
jgi:hypothetical protein